LVILFVQLDLSQSTFSTENTFARFFLKKRNKIKKMNKTTMWNKKTHQATLGTKSVATPLWPSVGVNPNTPKVGDLESSGTPECLGFNKKAQKTLH
jgi:hypothetical protein